MRVEAHNLELERIIENAVLIRKTINSLGFNETLVIPYTEVSKEEVYSLINNSGVWQFGLLLDQTGIESKITKISVDANYNHIVNTYNNKYNKLPKPPTTEYR